MNRLIELLNSKKGRGAILGAIAALIFLITGQRVPQETLDKADSAIEATIELAAPATAPVPASDSAE